MVQNVDKSVIVVKMTNANYSNVVPAAKMDILKTFTMVSHPVFLVRLFVKDAALSHPVLSVTRDITFINIM
jgi:hypothetical protein